MNTSQPLDILTELREPKQKVSLNSPKTPVAEPVEVLGVCILNFFCGRSLQQSITGRSI